MKTTKNPIFIVGTGRCGSTVFHHIMSRHPNVAWLTKWNDRFPENHAVNRFAMQLLDHPLMPASLIRKLVFPVEAYPFWRHHSGIIERPFRDLTKEDVTPETAVTIRHILSEQTTRNRNRILVKITGWPRIGFLKEIFPDAKFIHVYRDGRAVANSFMQVWFWAGWNGPYNWKWGTLDESQLARWEEHDRSFVALAGLEWEILMKAFSKAKARIPRDDFMEFSYEELCEKPESVLERAVKFAGLEWSGTFRSLASEFKLRNTNDKWKKDLTADQQKILNSVIRDTLAEYGYSAE